MCITPACGGPLLPLRSIAWKCSQTVGMGFILLLFLEALFDLLCSSPSVFPLPSQAGEFFLRFLTPWAAEGHLNWSLDLLD